MNLPSVFVFTFLLTNVVASLASVARLTMVGKQDYTPELTKIYNNLFDNYDKRIRPYHTEDKALQVNVSTHLLSVVDVDESKMSVTVNIFFRQSWTDPRLKYTASLLNIKPLVLNSDQIKNLWVPDTFFGTERESKLHQMTVPNDLVTIGSDGTVLRSMRITLTSFCPFQYERFPFDSQECLIIIGSHGLTVEDIIYQWSGHFTAATDAHATQFFVTQAETMEHISELPYGKVSRLHLSISLQRSWKPFISRFYFPMVLFVFISIFSMWIIDQNISLGINLFNIAFINIFMAIRFAGPDMPKTLTRTKMDVYYLICIFFVCFATAVNFATLHFQRSKDCLRQAERPLNEERARNNSLDLGEDETENAILYRPTTYRIRLLSKTQVFFKYVKRFTLIVCRYAKWILTIGFVTTDFIYFYSSAVRFTVHPENGFMYI